MLRLLFGRGRERDQLGLFHAEARHIGYARPTLGNGARLVEHDVVELVDRLQRLRVFEQDPVFRALAGADHDRGGRGQAQRAGAGDDEHGDEHGQAESEVLACERPGDCGQQRYAHDDRHKHAGDLVGCARDRRLGVLRLLNGAYDLRQGGIPAYFARFNAQKSVFVDCRARDRVAGRLVDRHALAGQHGFVHGALALDDYAVHGDLLAGPDGDDIADGHLLHGYFNLFSVPQYDRSLGCQVQQLLDRARRPALGPGFKRLAQQDKGDDDGGRFIVEPVHGVRVAEQ